MTTLTLISLSCAALFLFARPDGAQNLPAAKADNKRYASIIKPSMARSGRSKAASKTAASKVAASKAAAPKQPVVSAEADQEGLDYYIDNVRGSMFSAPQPPKVKAPVAVVVKPKPIYKPPIVVLPPINPFAEWSYTGTVHMGDITMALLENTRTKEGQYVKSGDSFMGAQVQSINDQMVTLTNAGKPSMLAKADTIVVTPLNQNAAGQTPQTQPGQQPGQPQNGQVQNAMPAPVDTQFSLTLPNGRTLTGDRATRYQQRLDRGFSGGANGGGRNGGGGNGGGGRRRGGGGNGGNGG